MIDHQEAWQVFSQNGSPLAGQTILPTESRKTDAIIVGAVHIWVWRKTESGIEVLLEKRASTKPTWPGYLDISTAGHIDAGESLFEAAIREADEEIGLKVDSEKLIYFFGYRNFDNGLKWVYLYEITEPVEFAFNDGEVESLDWVKLEDFENMTIEPEKYNLVPHPQEYFGLLLSALKRQ